MNQLDTKRLATIGLLVILSLFVLLHLAIMLGIIPFGMVWGGRLQDRSQMLSFEAISVAVNLLMLAVVSIHAGFLKVNVSSMLIRGALWAMFVLFLLNTLGNALSTNQLEKLLFTPLTLLLSLSSLRLALDNKPAKAF